MAQDWDPASPPPASKWQRATADRADAAPTWGLRGAWLARLAASRLRAVLEVQSRLAALYPDAAICHMPSEAIQMGLPRGKGTAGASSEEGEENEEDEEGEGGGRAAGSAPATVAKEPRAAGVATMEAGAAGALESVAVVAPPSKAAVAPAAAMAPAAAEGPRAQDGMPTTRGPGDAQAGKADDEEGVGGAAGQAPAFMAVGASGSAAEDAKKEEEAGMAREMDEAAGPPGTAIDCNQFVANAAMHGDAYSWHVDADPSTLPFPSPWTLEYGQYINREPGRPLFVSLLLYLNARWDREWDAETLFLDTPSDCGVLVRPKPYRAVLLDQDILHRLSTPSLTAAGRPRYSLVWKLVFLPRRPGQRLSLARPQWGRPSAFGSAALLERVMAGLAAGGKRDGAGGTSDGGDTGGGNAAVARPPNGGASRGPGDGREQSHGDGEGDSGTPRCQQQQQPMQQMQELGQQRAAPARRTSQSGQPQLQPQPAQVTPRQQQEKGAAALVEAVPLVQGQAVELCRPGGGRPEKLVVAGPGWDAGMQQQQGREDGGAPAEEYWEWLVKSPPTPESPYGSEMLRALIAAVSPKFAVKRPEGYVPRTPSSISSSRYVRSDVWGWSVPTSPGGAAASAAAAAAASAAGLENDMGLGGSAGSEFPPLHSPQENSEGQEDGAGADGHPTQEVTWLAAAPDWQQQQQLHPSGARSGSFDANAEIAHHRRRHHHHQQDLPQHCDTPASAPSAEELAEREREPPPLQRTPGSVLATPAKSRFFRLQLHPLAAGAEEEADPHAGLLPPLTAIQSCQKAASPSAITVGFAGGRRRTSSNGGAAEPGSLVARTPRAGPPHTTTYNAQMRNVTFASPGGNCHAPFHVPSVWRPGAGPPRRTSTGGAPTPIAGSISGGGAYASPPNSGRRTPPVKHPLTWEPPPLKLKPRGEPRLRGREARARHRQPYFPSPRSSSGAAPGVGVSVSVGVSTSISSISTSVFLSNESVALPPLSTASSLQASRSNSGVGRLEAIGGGRTSQAQAMAQTALGSSAGVAGGTSGRTGVAAEGDDTRWAVASLKNPLLQSHGYGALSAVDADADAAPLAASGSITAVDEAETHRTTVRRSCFSASAARDTVTLRAPAHESDLSGVPTPAAAAAAARTSAMASVAASMPVQRDTAVHAPAAPALLSVLLRPDSARTDYGSPPSPLAIATATETNTIVTVGATARASSASTIASPTAAMGWRSRWHTDSHGQGHPSTSPGSSASGRGASVTASSVFSFHMGQAAEVAAPPAHAAGAWATGSGRAVTPTVERPAGLPLAPRRRDVAGVLGPEPEGGVAEAEAAVLGGSRPLYRPQRRRWALPPLAVDAATSPPGSPRVVLLPVPEDAEDGGASFVAAAAVAASPSPRLNRLLGSGSNRRYSSGGGSSRPGSGRRIDGGAGREREQAASSGGGAVAVVRQGTGPRGVVAVAVPGPAADPSSSENTPREADHCSGSDCAPALSCGSGRSTGGSRSGALTSSGDSWGSAAARERLYRPRYRPAEGEKCSLRPPSRGPSTLPGPKPLRPQPLRL
ncbi:hypothetical protein GPECTOR_17g779 [Gonium pectorale]|uniref:Fe2OG dioxygenase domain-containing protein n=1 Tax=Gonium pectorale TaxID=33097 RepID=A0A150GK00_GONPE|nr:hypothetical protein GPECTOR_17g779 [Gonium pectorale]|eukprot:KXZ50143.1 hypothetical protein GPECTOR_17g779 [Gonium pectorale]